jgi:uncharacterized repeat protein (TIGR01451 family)
MQPNNRKSGSRSAELVLGVLAALCMTSYANALPPQEANAATEQTPSAVTEQAVKTFALNAYKRELDGQWQGIRLASDGNVYFASSSHSAHHGASFFEYDTTTGQVIELVHEVTDLCGEDVQTNPQGKIHSAVVEANGWLYFATHFAAEKPGAWETWTGSHALGYELATGTWRDYGVILAGYTDYSAIGVDPVRNYLYVFLTGQTAGQAAYVYRIDTVTGEKVNLGQVSPPSAGGFEYSSPWMFVDQRGDVWFAIKNENGDLRQIHGDTGEIEVHANALPPLIRWDSNQVDTDPAVQAARSINWMQPLDGDRALLTMSPSGGMLYGFDSTQPMSNAFTPMRHIGFNYLGGLALGGNRVFYYQRENRAYGNQEFHDFHLLSVSLDAALGYPIVDHGLMVDQDGRSAWRTPGMVADGQGDVYLVGDWWTIPGDLGTLRYDWNGGDEIYEQLDRGEFFAVADVDIPAPAATDLSISGTAPSPVGVNAPFSYAIQVRNNAATAATGLQVTDALPAGVSFVSAASDSGTCSKYGSIVTCSLLSLSPGATASITITVNPPGGGYLTNSVSVEANEYDPDTSNNSASQTTSVLETVQLTAVTYSAAESAGSVVAKVTRTGTGAISVGYVTSDNTATAGSDYTATSGMLLFSSGEASKSIVIPLTPDTAPEGNEAFNLALTSPVGALLGKNRSASLIILDDDVYTPPTLDFSAVDFSVGEATASKSITVSRTGDSTATVTVTWSAASNTAVLGADFTAGGGVLTFDPGVTSKTFTVGIVNDTLAEGNESGYLLLSNPTGGARLGARPNATLTITDNDVPTSGFRFSATSYTASESGNKSITISRTGTTAAQSVTFKTSDGTASAGTDYTAVSTVVSFAVGEGSKTVSIPILTDTIPERNETVNLTLSNPTGGGTLGTMRRAVLFITDNDAYGTLQFKNASYTVGEAATTATITVTRTTGTYGAVDVTYATSDNTATAGSDYTATSGTLSFAQGQTSKTFTVSILNDTDAEPPESLNLTLSNPTGGATLGQARRAVLAITDND